MRSQLLRAEILTSKFDDFVRKANGRHTKPRRRPQHCETKSTHASGLAHLSTKQNYRPPHQAAPQTEALQNPGHSKNIA